MNAAINLLEPAPYKLYKAWELAALQPLDYTVKGLLPSYGVASIFGASMSGKSFLSFDMGAKIALGQHWFGYRTKPKPVAYFGLEGQAGITKRWAAYKQRYGDEAESMMDFGVDPINLGSPDSVESVIASLDVMRFAGGVVIIDTLACAMAGLQENDSASMGLALTSARQIADAYKCLVILVHHTGKDSGKGPRGSSALTANLDALIEVRREGKTNNRSWAAYKVKDGVDGGEFAFSLGVVEVGIDSEGDVIDSCVIEPMGEVVPIDKPLTGSNRTALDALRSVIEHQATPADLADRYSLPSPTDIAKLSDWKTACLDQGITSSTDPESQKRCFNRAAKALTDLGKVIVDGEWAWLT